MKNIFMVVLNESGHLLPTYTIANKLKSTGLYNIIYIADKEYEKTIVKHGFVFEKEYSYDNINFQHIYNITRKPKNIISRYKWVFSGAMELFHKQTTAYFKNLMVKYQPAAIFIDDLLVNYMIAFYSYKIPLITLSTYLFSHMDNNVPPPNSPRIPNSSKSNKLLIKMDWYLLFIKRFVSQIYLKILYPGGDYYHRSFAKFVNFPHKERLTYKKAYWIGEKRNDTIVLCPKYFDFPREVKDNVFYVESCVDIARPEKDFNWNVIKNCNPIVYCSLGTQAHKYIPNSDSFYKKIIEAFRKRNNFNLIISIGKTTTLDKLGNLPDNVFVYENVPQMQILKKSIFAITHGGLGTIKESIYFAVPVLVYPVNMQSDQNGNASRVVYHKIGLKGDIRKDNQEKIDAAISEMISNKQIKQNIIKMQTLFLEFEKKEPFMFFFKSRIELNNTIIEKPEANEINYIEESICDIPSLHQLNNVNLEN